MSLEPRDGTAMAGAMAALLARPEAVLDQARADLARLRAAGGPGIALGDCFAAARALARAARALEQERAAILDAVAVLLAASLSSRPVRGAPAHDPVR
jgi:hypothetical protein